MAATVEGAFVLLDRASPKLRDIRREARATDRQLSHLGDTLDGVGSDDQLRDLDRTSRALRNVDRAAKGPIRSVNDFARSVLGLNKVSRDSDRHLIILGNRMGPLGRAFDSAAESATNFAAGLIAIGKAHPMIAGIVALTPAIIALGEAVGGLAVSLGAAVGGGVTLAGGLFAVAATGIGTMAAAAIPAASAIGEMTKAQEDLNEAIQSGDTAKIREAQRAVNALAKEHPGVTSVASAMQGLGDQWRRLSRPAQSQFFKLATSGIRTLRKLMPMFAEEAQRNLASVRSAFDNIIGPSLRSKGFREFFKDLNSIFRSNVPGFSKGLVYLGKAFQGILKVIEPWLRGFGEGFAHAMESFNEAVRSNKGQKMIQNMVEAFQAWMHLIGSVFRLFGRLITLMGTKGKTDGTDVIEGWADAVDKFTDSLTRKGVSEFFDNAFDKAGKFLSAMWNIVDAVGALVDPLSAVSNTLAEIIDRIPTELLTGGIVLGGAKFLTSKGRGITGIGGAPSGSLRDPLFVVDVTGRGGGAAGGKGGKGGTTVAGGSSGKGGSGGGSRGGGGGGRGGLFGKLGGLAGGLAGKAKGLGGFARSAGLWGAAIGGTAGAINMVTGNHSLRDSIQMADPTSLLNLVGLPSLSDVGQRYSGREGFANLASDIGGLFSPDGDGPTSAGSLPAPGITTNMNPKGGAFGVPTAFANGANNGLKKFTDKVDELPKKTKRATDKTGTNFEKLSRQVKRQMGLATSSVSTGSAAIMRDLWDALEKMGVSRDAGITPSGIAFRTPGEMAQRRRAGGGRIPGRGLYDTVPIGDDVMAAPGELIVNRHTEGRINRALAPYGTSLGREVEREGRPHSMSVMAKGGRFKAGGRVRGGGPGGGIAAAGALATQMGLHASGGPGYGGIPSSGHAPNSLHYSGLALDVSGSAGLMRSYFLKALHMFGSGLNELFYDPMGYYIDNGSRVSGAIGGHSDHVHIGLMAGAAAGMMAGLGGAGGMMGKPPKIKGQRARGAGLFGALGQSALDTMQGAAQQKVNKAFRGGMGGGGTPKAIARQMLRQYGWGLDQFAPLDSLWTRESGWRVNATNPSSGAYGIPQSLPASKMASAGPDWRTNPATQIKWGLGYIKDRYGSPAAAWGHSQSTGWYSHGGRIPWFGGGGDFIADRPQLIGVGDKRERVTITPEGAGAGRRGAGGIKIGAINVANHRPGDVKKQIKKEIAEAFNELSHELDFQPMLDEREASGIG